MLSISPLEAAKFINAHLGLGLDVKPTKESYAYSNRYNQKQIAKKIFAEWENKTFQLLCDYLHLLWKLEEEYKPKNFNDEIDDLYVEALQNKDKIEYYIDLFIYGTEQDKMWFKRTNGKVVERIGRRIRRRNP